MDPMRYYLGLATTFHDPALALVGPDGTVLFAEATERYLQYKRAPNCEPDSAPRMAGLLKAHLPPGAELVIATTWGPEFSRYLRPTRPGPGPSGSRRSTPIRRP